MRTGKPITELLTSIKPSCICVECATHGCVNAADQEIPCACDQKWCSCDDVCICECHNWDTMISFARTCLAEAEKRLGITNVY